MTKKELIDTISEFVKTSDDVFVVLCEDGDKHQTLLNGDVRKILSHQLLALRVTIAELNKDTDMSVLKGIVTSGIFDDFQNDEGEKVVH